MLSADGRPCELFGFKRSSRCFNSGVRLESSRMEENQLTPGYFYAGKNHEQDTRVHVLKLNDVATACNRLSVVVQQQGR